MELNSVTQLNSNSFNSNSNSTLSGSTFTKISFPNLTEVKGQYGLANNPALTEVNLGKAKSLGDKLLQNCDALAKIYLKSTKHFPLPQDPETSTIAKPQDVKIYVRNKELKTDLDTNLNWFIYNHKAENVIYQGIFYTSDHTLVELKTLLETGELDGNSYFKVIDDADVLKSNADINFQNSVESVEEIDLTTSSISIIPENYFKNSGATIIKLPETVIRIGPSAFQNAEKLTTIVLTNTIGTYFDPVASTGVNKDVSIVVSNDSDYDTLAKDKHIFIDTHQALNVNKGLFITTPDMTKETLENVVKYDSTYYGIIDNINLYAEKGVTISKLPDNITLLKVGSINNNAPFGAKLEGDNLHNLTLSGIDVTIPSLEKSDLETIDISNALLKNNEIPDNTFKNCIQLISVTLNEYVTEIGESAFENCGEIKFIIETEATFVTNASTTKSEIEFIIQNPIIYAGIVDEAGIISKNNISLKIINKNIRSISLSDINNNINSIIDSTNCTFENITLSGTGSIPSFTGNSNLRTIDLTTYSASNIPDDCFKNCDNLYAIITSTSTKVFGNEAFTGCKRLSNVVISNTSKLTFGNKCTGINSSCKVYVSIVNKSDAAVYFGGEVVELNYEPLIYSGENPQLDFSVNYANDVMLIPNPINIPSGTLSRKINDDTILKSRDIGGNLDKKIVSVVIDNVDIIDNDLFSDCINLTDVTISKTVKTICSGAFKNCIGLTEVDIPETVTEITNQLFEGCNSLTRVGLNGDITAIGKSAFAGCENLTDINIPDTVKSIGSSAFSVCKSLTKINIPELVTEIEDYTFYGCEKLEQLKLPRKLELINDFAFYGCACIDEIFIPNKVTHVGKSAFSGCSKASYLHLSKSMTVISESSFNECIGIDDIVIPESVITISDFAFSGCSNAGNIVIGSNVISIGNNAFNGCSYAKMLVIPMKVTKIGFDAFSGCSGLELVQCFISSNTGSYSNTGAKVSQLQTLTKTSSTVKNKLMDMFGTEECVDVDIVYYEGANPKLDYSTKYPNYIILLPSPTNPPTGTISRSGGSGNIQDKLVYAIIDGVETIYDGTDSIHLLDSKDNMRVIVIGDSVKTIGNYGIVSCYRYLSLGKNIKTIKNYSIRSIHLTELDIPDGVTYLGEYLLKWCGIKRLYIPETVTYLGNNVFYENDGIKHVKCYMKENTGSFTTCPTPVSHLDLNPEASEEFKNKLINMFGYQEEGYEIITYSSGNIDLTTKTYTKDIKLVPQSGITFSGEFKITHNSETKRRLISAEIANGFTSIANDTFKNCVTLQNVTMSDTITSIGNYAFSECSVLRRLKLSSALTSLGSYVFSNCWNVDSLIIPYGVTKINECGIQHCHGLKTLILPDSITEIKNFGVDNIGAYKLILSKSLNTVGSTAAMHYNRTLYRLIIPKSMTKIPSEMLQYAYNMRYLYIPEVTYIGSSAFKNCYSLKEVVCMASDNTSGYYTATNASVENLVLNPKADSSVKSNLKSMFGASSYKGGILYSGSTPTIDYSINTTDDLIVMPDPVDSPTGTLSRSGSGGNIADHVVEIKFDKSKVSEEEFKGITSLADADTPTNGLFYNFTHVTKVDIYKTITHIGNYAFNNCNGIESLTIPEGVDYIGTGAFAGCSRLKFVNCLITQNTGDYTYTGAKVQILIVNHLATTEVKENLKSMFGAEFYIEDDKPIVYYSGANPVIEDDTVYVDNVTLMPDPVNVPSGTLSMVDKGGNLKNKLVNVTIDKVDTIADNTFEDCVKMTDLKISSSVTNIGTNAFSGCVGLENVTCMIVSNSGSFSITGGNIKSVIVNPKTTETIADNIKIMFGANEYKAIVYYSGENPVLNFSEVYNLNITLLPDPLNWPSGTLSSTGSGYKNKYGYITLDGIDTVATSLFSSGNVRHLIVGSSMRTIGDNAFKQNYGLSHFNFEEGLETIGASAFYNCSCFMSVILPNTLKSIGQQAFYQCFSMNLLYIPASVTYLGGSAFAQCRDLLDVVCLMTSNTGYFSSTGSTVENLIVTKDSPVLSSIQTMFNTTTSIPTNGILYYSGENPVINDSNTYTDNVILLPDPVNKPSGVLSTNITGNLKEHLAAFVCGDNIITISNNAFENCVLLSYVEFFSSHNIVNYGNYSLSNINISNLTLSELNGKQILGEGICKNCQKLTLISTWFIKSIPNNAFENCVNLQHIVCYGGEENVVSIGDSAFKGCVELLEVHYLGTALKTIGASAFENCEKLKETGQYTQIIKYAETIGNNAFKGCKSLTSAALNPNLTTISDGAFSGCEGLAAISIHNNITAIGNDAFNGCVGLLGITIGNLVTTIGQSAFESCTGLTSATIGNSVTTIGESAFEGCTDLETVIIPNSITTIGNKAFKKCVSLVDASAGVFTIPNSVTTIGESAFYECKALTSINVPNSVTTLGDSAFESCEALTSVIIGNSLTKIGNSVFKNCSKISSLTIPDNIISIGESAFYGCNSVTTLSLGTGLTLIGKEAFKECSKVSTILISEQVNTIGEGAFYGCSGMKTLYIPVSVNNIGVSAFEGCTSLETVTCLIKSNSGAYTPTGGSVSKLYVNPTAPAAVISGVNTMFGGTGISALYYGGNNPVIDYSINYSSNVVLLPSPTNPPTGTVTRSGNGGNLDEKLVKVEISGVTLADGTDKTSGVFSGCKGLTDVEIGTGAVIGDYAFSGCVGLTSVPKLSTFTTIPKGAFEDCTGITTLVIPDNITTINEDAFKGCSGATTLYIPESVTHIAAGVFDDCTGLTKVMCMTKSNSGSVVQYTNVSVSDLVVSGKYQLKTDIQNMFGATSYKNVVYYSGENPVINKGDTYYDNFELLPNPIYPPTGMLSGSGSGTSFKNNVVKAVLDGIESTKDYAESESEAGLLFNCDNLITVIVSNTVTIIGSCSFNQCHNLTNVTLSNSITRIGNSSFAYCNLTNITIPDSVTTIWGGAFYNCSELTSIIIPNKVTNIGNHGFYNCSSLNFVYIPSSVTTIGSNAFSNCGTIDTVICLTTDESASFATSSNTVNNLYVSPSANTNMISKIKQVFKNSSPQKIDIVYYSGENPSVDYSTTFTNKVILLPDPVKQPTKTLGYSGSGGNIATNLIMAVIDGVDTLADGVSYTGVFANCNNMKYLSISNTVKNIGNYAFCDCSGLTTVNIPDSVTNIGEGAFGKCDSLTSINIPNKVTLIKNYVFSMCSHLTTVNIHNSITNIGKGAFYHCSGISSLTIPNNVTSIEESAFESCVGLTIVNIPNGVTNIGDYAFSGCNGITSLSLGTGLTTIGNNAFSSCSKISSLTIPDNVTSIGYYAFQSCGITTLSLGTGLTTIGKGAFNVCSSVTTVNIPDNVINIGDYAFSGCSGITTLSLGTGLTTIGISAFKGCSGIISLTIPDNVTSIGEDAFYGCSSITTLSLGTGLITINKEVFRNCSKISSLTIPDNVTIIKDYAFYSCSSITTLSLGTGLTTIGNRAFSSCSKISSLTIPDNVTSIGESAFEDCSYAKTLNLGTGLTIIGNSAFSGCSMLQSINIPDNITTIGDGAFQGSGITTLYIPESVTSIGENAFSYCTSLKNVTCLITQNFGFYYAIGVSATNLILNAKADLTTKSKLQSMFGASSYKNVCYYSGENPNVDKSVNYYGNFEFLPHPLYPPTGTLGWTGTNISFNNNVTKIEINGVTSITDGSTSTDSAFNNCINITDVSISDTVTSIGKYTFHSCVKINSINIPNSITRIEEYTFTDCSGMKILNIPDTVTYIGTGAFSGCSGLKNVTCLITQNTGVYTLTGATADILMVNHLADKTTVQDELTKMFGAKNTVVDTVKIEYYKNDVEFVFPSYDFILLHDPTDTATGALKTNRSSSSSSDNYLKTVIMDDTTTSISNHTLYDCKGLTSVIIGDSVTTIGVGVFAFCTSLTSVNIPNSVTSIGDIAFYICSSLTTLNIPNSVTSIGSGAFSNCSKLTKINIPNLVTTIGSNVFYYCSSLKSITIPNSVNSIGIQAFKNCSELTTLYIPSSVTNIGSEAFSGCSKLKYVTCLITATSGINYDSTGSTVNALVVNHLANNTIKTNLKNMFGAKIVTDDDKVVYYGGENSTIEDKTTYSDNITLLPDITNWPSGTLSRNTTTGNLKDYLKNVVLDGITETSTGLFSDFENIDNLIIENTVTKIGNTTFKNCSGITSLNIPDTVTYIGTDAFVGCSGLTSVTCLITQNTGAYTLTGAIVETLTVNYLADDAIKNNLKTMFGAKNVVYNDATIEYYKNDVEFIFPEYNFVLLHDPEDTATGALKTNRSSSSTNDTYLKKIIIDDYKTTSISDYAFYKCAGLTGSLVISNGITTIKGSAFAGCGLTYVNVTNPVTIIEMNAFMDCLNLTSIRIGNSITNIGDATLYGCSNLTSINMYGNITNIGNFAFTNCSSLTSITIPDKVTKIKNGIFNNCSNLSTINITSTSQISFDMPSTGLASGCVVHVKPINETGAKAYFSGCTVVADL